MSSNPVLFRTVHGSRLYGLNHAASDDDFYQVVDRPTGARKQYARQNISGSDDTMTVNLGTFVTMADAGVPQALEAMFSDEVLGDDYLAALRHGYRVNLGQMLTTYRRTVSNFATGDFKRRRHALRLAFNFEQATRRGRFTPRLTSEQAQMANEAAADLSLFLPTLLEVFPYLDVPETLSRGYKGGTKDVPVQFLDLLALSTDERGERMPERPYEGDQERVVLRVGASGTGHVLEHGADEVLARARSNGQEMVACFFEYRPDPED